MSAIELIQPGDAAPDAATQRPDAIPPATWAKLQEAGEKAAERLLDLIDKPSFTKLRTSDQVRLIELAMTRAYGPPIQRQQTLQLSGRISDAVATGLAEMSRHDLPEHSRQKG